MGRANGGRHDACYVFVVLSLLLLWDAAGFAGGVLLLNIDRRLRDSFAGPLCFRSPEQTTLSGRRSGYLVCFAVGT